MFSTVNTANPLTLCKGSFRKPKVGPTTPVSEVARLMVKKRIHHVAVTENRSIQGFVSSFDFVEQFVLKGSPNP